MTFFRFLFNSGILENYTAKTDGVKFINNSGKAFFLLFEDIEVCLKAIWERLPDIVELMGNSWEYEEGKFRKIFGEVLKNVPENTVTAQLGSQTINTVKILGLYSAYISKVKNLKSSYDEKIYVNPEWIEKAGLFKSDWISFLGWLKRYSKDEEKSRLSSRSIESYFGAVNGFLSKIAGTHLLMIKSLKEFEELRSFIEQNPIYNEQNTSGNRMYSRALDLYQEYLMNISNLCDFEDQISDGGMYKCLLASSLAKPFTILTGASGTGKTKLAEKLAAYLSTGDNSCLVAVGADWTDNRSVVGFVNHLRTLPGEGLDLPVYQSTPVLDLILRAVRAPDIPYFLILDEMNLSHVERYFSDFLSAMEQKDGKLLLHSESASLPRFEGDEEKVPPSVPYPENLFVIGTVNVDETTYMFSPKVLDRANVIEFSVDKNELTEFIRDPQPYPDTQPAGIQTAKAFLNLAVRARKGELEKLDFKKIVIPLGAHVEKLFDIMQAGRFEFAFRSTYELIRFLQISRQLSDDKEAWDDGGWLEDFDVQILQKLLPRLHGSAGRIGSLLVKLAQYCYDRTIPEDSPGFDGISSLDPEKAYFKKSFGKLKSMIETLQEEHFVSFIC